MINNLLKKEKSYLIEFLIWDDLPLSVLQISFNFPPLYPVSSPPIFQINSSWLTIQQINTLQNQLIEIYQEIKPDTVIFRWIDYIRSEGWKLFGVNKEEMFGSKEVSGENGNENEEEVEEASLQSHTFSILACSPISDRKSKFQAFLAQVHSLEDVSNVLKQLKSNKKIAIATHNMYAYRIIHDSKVLEGREDDGEGGGGDKILYILQIKKAENIIIIVTRWYGGIHLGQTRFKHITDCATNAYDKWKNTTSLPASSGSNNTKIKLRTSEDIYNQIKWDPAYDSSTCIIGYMDRFEGMHEISFEEWPTSDIPFHRVWYFKLGDKVVWDRKKREDFVKIK